MMVVVEGLVAGVLSAMMISISGAEREVADVPRTQPTSRNRLGVRNLETMHD